MDDEEPNRARVHRDIAVPDRLMASWQRSEDYGVSMETIDPVFTGTHDDESLFSECGREVLSGLHQTLVNEPVSLMLTDADGLVLNRLSGDTSLLRALDSVHLAPGFAYSEREAGTNGLGLALADRAPAVVRANEHYAASLCTYTCAAAPVLDPVSGRLQGAVNLTTWSESSSDLLLALAQSAAGNTEALMVARSSGQRGRPASRGEVFRVESARLEPGSGTLHDLSQSWAHALAEASAALLAGQVVAAIGEPGSGRATVLAQAQRQARPHDRILSARTPATSDTQLWLSLWAPELGKPHTAVIVSRVDTLPGWAADHLRSLVLSMRSDAAPAGFSVTAERFEDIPAPLAALVDTIVAVPSLRERIEDVVPLAHHLARKVRGRPVEFTAAAEHALTAYAWPGNANELGAVVRWSATRANVIDVRHLPPQVLSRTTHRLTRIEAFERAEIVRVLTRPGVTMKDAAAELGMSRATIYRKIAQYDLHIPR